MTKCLLSVIVICVNDKRLDSTKEQYFILCTVCIRHNTNYCLQTLDSSLSLAARSEDLRNVLRKAEASNLPFAIWQQSSYFAVAFTASSYMNYLVMSLIGR